MPRPYSINQLINQSINQSIVQSINHRGRLHKKWPAANNITIKTGMRVKQNIRHLATKFYENRQTIQMNKTENITAFGGLLHEAWYPCSLSTSSIGACRWRAVEAVPPSCSVCALRSRDARPRLSLPPPSSARYVLDDLDAASSFLERAEDFNLFG